MFAFIEKYMTKLESGETQRVLHQYQVREKNGQLWLMFGDIPYAKVSETATAKEIVAAIAEARAAKEEYDQKDSEL
jgi:hypothetical protein